MDVIVIFVFLRTFMQYEKDEEKLDIGILDVRYRIVNAEKCLFILRFKSWNPYLLF